MTMVLCGGGLLFLYILCVTPLMINPSLLTDSVDNVDFIYVVDQN